MENGAAEKTRTSTGFTPQRPQRCASTRSATAANYKIISPITKGYVLCKINNIFNVLKKGITKLFESVDWKISKNLISYDFAISEMEKRVLEIKQNSAKELVWLLEHQPIYTGGTSAKKEDLKNDKIETR